MRASNFIIFFLMVAVVVPAFAEDPPVQTTRDERGVWFIEGGDLYDVSEAMGYAVATDRLWQMDLYRRQGRGTLSELLGAELLGQNFINTDMFLRNWLYSEEELTDFARQWLQLAAGADKVYAFFNNCHAGHAARNAELMIEMLGDELGRR